MLSTSAFYSILSYNLMWRFLAGEKQFSHLHVQIFYYCFSWRKAGKDYDARFATSHSLIKEMYESAPK